MATSDQIRLRLFAEASADRSAELASALADRLAGEGQVQVRQLGLYWKIPTYLEFSIELTTAGSATACIGRLHALEPTGWSGDVWKRRPQGPEFLLPEVRWVWLSDDRGLAESDGRTRIRTIIAAAATMLLGAVSFWGAALVGLALATSCDRGERQPAVCTEGSVWFSSDGFLYLAFTGFGVAVIGAWIWPRRARGVWIGIGYLVALAGFLINVSLFRSAP